jgi:hypothetical protein
VAEAVLVCLVVLVDRTMSSPSADKVCLADLEAKARAGVRAASRPKVGAVVAATRTSARST